MESRYTQRILAPFLFVAIGVGAAACSSDTKHNGLSLETATSVDGTAPVGTETTAEGSTTTTTMTPELYDEVSRLFSTNQADLTFECDDEGAKSDAIEVKPLAGDNSDKSYVIPKQNYLLPVDSTKPDDDHRMWSDSYAPSVIADINDKEAVELNIKANGCEDVLTTYANLNFLARLLTTLQLPEGKTIADINPALVRFDVDPSEINDMAAATIERIGNMSSQEDLDAYNQFIDDARVYAGIIDNFENAGVQTETATSYFHLKNLGQEVNKAGVPEIEQVMGGYDDDPNTRIVENQFLVMQGTEKANGCVFQWGINIHDLRPAVLEDADCVKPVVTTTSHVGTTSTSTTTTAPRVTTTTTTVPTTTTEPRYDLSVCNLRLNRNEGGKGVVVHHSNLTAAQRDAILANPDNKSPYNSLGDSNGDGQEICK